MQQTKKTPKLRFKEFSGEWQVRNLGDISIFAKGKSLSKNDISKTGQTEAIRYGELYTRYGEVIKHVHSRTDLDTNNLELSIHNDIIIPASGETNIDIATASCVLRDGVVLGGDLNVIRTENNGVFLSYYLNSSKKNDIARLAQGNSVVHLYSSSLSKLTLNLPSNEEQQKIAEFLTNVDERIELQNKKVKLLQKYKKGIMQKIFSQQIRFKDKNSKNYPDWQQKKLGELGEFKTSSVDKLIRNDEKRVYLVNYMNVYRHEEISLKTSQTLNEVSANNTQIYTSNLKCGDILFTPSSETPSDIGHSVVITEDLPNTLFSYHLVRFRPKVQINLAFSHYFCNIPEVLKQIARRSQGSTRFTITVGEFSKVNVNLPTSISEQQKIADFLTFIDDKINLEKNKLKQANQFKKALLQRMFV